MQRKRFLAKSFGDNQDGTRAGIVNFVQNLPPDSQGVIVVPSLGNVSDTILVDVLGKDLSAQLIKNREIALDGGRRIYLCSAATLKNFQRATSYLALWASESTIDAIESLLNWTTATVVTWIPKDAERWIDTHAIDVIYDDGKG